MEYYVRQADKQIVEYARLNALSSLVDCEKIAREHHLEKEFVYEVFQGAFNKEFSRITKIANRE